jgi:ribosomal protein L40E
MRGQIDSLLEKGIEAARAGAKRRARDIFIHVIELDQRNEKAWLWLSSVVDETVDRIVCLENVLVVNPDNTYAATGLQKLREQPAYGTAARSLLPRLSSPRKSKASARGPSAAGTSAAAAEQVCPRCGFRNPGWAYLCDRCGADLRPVDVQEALGLKARPRGRSFFTVLEAWAAAFVLSRRWAFVAEVELASWVRSLEALLMALLFASGWRALTAVLLRLWLGGGGSGVQLVASALRCAAQTLWPASLLMLAYVPTALFTWLGGRLMGGRGGLKAHVHLTAVAFSAWIALIALLTSLMTFAPYLVGGGRRAGPLVAGTPALLGVAFGLTAVIWLTQAIRTAHRLPAARAIPITLTVIALGAAFYTGLALLGGEWLARLVDPLATFFFPWPGCGA